MLIVFSLHRESLKLILVNEPLPEVVLSHAPGWSAGSEAGRNLAHDDEVSAQTSAMEGGGSRHHNQLGLHQTCAAQCRCWGRRLEASCQKPPLASPCALSSIVFEGAQARSYETEAPWCHQVRLAFAYIDS
jgi:hypothetical protein